MKTNKNSNFYYCFFFIFFLFGIFETRQTNMKTRSQTKLQTTTEPVVAEKDFFEILQRNYGEQYKVADCSQMNHFELLNYLEKNRTQLDVISFVKRNERNDLYFQVTNLLSLVQDGKKNDHAFFNVDIYMTVHIGGRYIWFQTSSIESTDETSFVNLLNKNLVVKCQCVKCGDEPVSGFNNILCRNCNTMVCVNCIRTLKDQSECSVCKSNIHKKHKLK